MPKKKKIEKNVVSKRTKRTNFNKDEIATEIEECIAPVKTNKKEVSKLKLGVIRKEEKKFGVYCWPQSY